MKQRERFQSINAIVPVPAKNVKVEALLKLFTAHHSAEPSSSCFQLRYLRCGIHSNNINTLQ